MADRARPTVHPTLDLLGRSAWWLIGIGVVGYVALRLIGQLSLVVFPVYVAMLLAVVLVPVVEWFRRRGVHDLVAAWAGVLTLLAGLGLAGLLVVPALADQTNDLQDTVSQGIDDIEDWLVEDSPFEIERADIDELRSELGDAVATFLKDNPDQVLSGAILAAEVVTGAVLSLVILFFLLKDGRRFQEFWLGTLPEASREPVAAVARRVWETLRGYVLGSATLGLLEAVILAITLAVVGADLIVPVAVITFVAAFVPFVGAIVAGVVAVLVALVTGGATAAVTVAVVALLVQQFDNDLLAPVVFGKALDLHALVILLSITGFGALFGLAGAFLAVPVTASVINGYAVWRQHTTLATVLATGDADADDAPADGGPANSDA